MWREMLEEGRLYQLVVTTGFHTPNAAAMGITREGNYIKMRVFKGSDTYRNLKVDKRFAVHIVPASRVRYLLTAALTGWGDSKPEFPPKDFYSFHGVPFLRDLENRFICRTYRYENVEVEDDIGRSKALDIIAEVFRDETHENVRPIRHKELDIVEAAVWATRWKAADEDNKKRVRRKARYYLRKAKGTAAQAHIEMLERFLKSSALQLTDMV